MAMNYQITDLRIENSNYIGLSRELLIHDTQIVILNNQKLSPQEELKDDDTV